MTEWTQPAKPRLATSLVFVVVRMLVEELRWRLSRDPALESRYLEGDDEVEHDSLLLACAVVGVEPSEYQFALNVDGDLFQLHHWAVTEAVCGTTDPGPYDRISRESPSGTERNEHLNGCPWRTSGSRTGRTTPGRGHFRSTPTKTS